MNRVEILGVVFLEPVSAITDVLCGIVGFIVAYKLLLKQNSGARHFINYFVFMGISTILAGTLGHGFQHYLSTDWKTVGWSFSAIALFFFELASINLFKDRIYPRAVKLLIAICAIQVILFQLLIFIPETRVFRVVQLNLTFGYVGFIIPLYTIAFLKWKVKNSKRLFTAIAVAGLASVAFNLRLSLHQWFDHNVVAHFIITGFLILMYTAVIKLLDTETSKQFQEDYKLKSI